MVTTGKREDGRAIIAAAFRADSLRAKAHLKLIKVRSTPTAPTNTKLLMIALRALRAVTDAGESAEQREMSKSMTLQLTAASASPLPLSNFSCIPMI